eukprot:2256140-Rhodomonas_salina.2
MSVMLFLAQGHECDALPVRCSPSPLLAPRPSLLGHLAAPSSLLAAQKSFDFIALSGTLYWLRTER